MQNVISILRERGFIDQESSEKLEQAAHLPLKVYCGFDPSANSLHLGNLVPIMGLAWFQRFGHTPVVIVGGATGMIGDPGGKSQERNLLDEATIAENLKGITKNLSLILGQREPKAVILNNFEWFRAMTYIDFLRDVGKYFRLGPMLAKDSVKGRMQSEEGMSFTEFCYQTLQGYDFLYLKDNEGVSVQMGGADQWGNITAGIELIRKVRGQEVFGLSFPLLTRADGQKFGKSESGAIWLSPEKLSVYEFYQYLIRVDDRDVIRLLKMLTFLDLPEIEAIEKSMKAPGYVPNEAQKKLAQEVTRLVHGPAGVEMAEKVTEAARPGGESALTVEVLEEMAPNMPGKEAAQEHIVGSKLVDLIALLEIMPSKGEVRRLIKNDGLFLNNQKVVDETKIVTEIDLIGGKFLVVSTGKKNKTLIRVKK